MPCFLAFVLLVQLVDGIPDDIPQPWHPRLARIRAEDGSIVLQKREDLGQIGDGQMQAPLEFLQLRQGTDSSECPCAQPGVRLHLQQEESKPAEGAVSRPTAQLAQAEANVRMMQSQLAQEQSIMQQQMKILDQEVAQVQLAKQGVTQPVTSNAELAAASMGGVFASPTGAFGVSNQQAPGPLSEGPQMMQAFPVRMDGRNMRR
mmetsp:Transcript_52340/g.93911  ORF Transcript_52340/g.93911 Transcript_52340/m.93911 type:complete len:204 (+) Transcript_52340:202-813(+)